MAASAHPSLPASPDSASADTVSADAPLLAKTNPAHKSVWNKYEDILRLDTRHDWTTESYLRIAPADMRMARDLRREYKAEKRTKNRAGKRRVATAINPHIAKSARDKIKPATDQAIIDTARKRIETMKRWDKIPFTYADAQMLFGDIPIDPAYSPDMVVAVVHGAIREKTLAVPTPPEFHAYVRETLK